jgi:hypothetical protein
MTLKGECDRERVVVQMKSDREAKLELLKHFGWDHGLPAGKSAVFKEDKAIQSLTTQVQLPASQSLPL